MNVASILAESLTGLVVLLLVFFVVPLKNSQLRVLVAVLAGLAGFFIVYRLLS